MAKMSLASLVGFQSTPSARRATALKDRIINREQEFQSTPSARRATVVVGNCHVHVEQFQSTPSARRATHGDAC